MREIKDASDASEINQVSSDINDKVYVERSHTHTHARAIYED